MTNRMLRPISFLTVIGTSVTLMGIAGCDSDRPVRGAGSINVQKPARTGAPGKTAGSPAPIAGSPRATR
jgi:hypothetical protein